MGFCRTNLFKRLESSGAAFVQSVERHALRNYIFLHALRNGLPIPVGTQDAEMLDSRFIDEDVDEAQGASADPEDETEQEADGNAPKRRKRTPMDARGVRATRNTNIRRVRYPGSSAGSLGCGTTCFRHDLETELQNDADALIALLRSNGTWDPAQDAKLAALQELITESYPDRKSSCFPSSPTPCGIWKMN